MPVEYISTVLTSLSSASTIAKALIDLKVSSEVVGKVIELQSQIVAAQTSTLAAQEQQHELRKQIESLERDIAKLREWDSLRGQYPLREISPGVYVRELNDPTITGEPAHWLCCNCFDQHEKSILQWQNTVNGIKAYRCHRCNSVIRDISGHKKPDPSPPRGNDFTTRW
jgi:hypothetical protein